MWSCPKIARSWDPAAPVYDGSRSFNCYRAPNTSRITATPIAGLKLPNSATMISRSSAIRLAFRGAQCARPMQRRAFATGPLASSYETFDASGVKVASRDLHGPTATLAVVAKAGTRYQPLPGLTVGLEEFAFKVSLLWHRSSRLRSSRLPVCPLCPELISGHDRRTRRSVPPFESRENPSCLEAN
jgi:hypothetical protein